MCFTRIAASGANRASTPAHPHAMVVLNYPQMMLGALFVNPAPQSILIVGLGGGTLPTRARRRSCRDAAHRRRRDRSGGDTASRTQYFGFEASTRRTSIESDGRVYVKRAHARRAALRPDHARRLRPRIHSRASADAEFLQRSEVAADAAGRAGGQYVLVEPACTITSRSPTRRHSGVLQPEAGQPGDRRAARRAAGRSATAHDGAAVCGRIRHFWVQRDRTPAAVHAGARLGPEGARADGSVLAGEPPEPER